MLIKRPACLHLKRSLASHKLPLWFFITVVPVSLLVALFWFMPYGRPDKQFYITDSQGRALILHGINVSNNAKNDPLRVGTIDKETIFRFSRDFGFNAVRMLIFWDAIEPEKGVFDQAYLDRIKERLDWYKEAGIFVVLDMHQDVYSSVFRCDGAPEWAVRSDGLSYEPDKKHWWRDYEQPAVKRAFDNFWDAEGPHRDLQEHYALAWVKVAERFKDHPAVLGYDLINEPHQGTADNKKFEKDKLKNFYNRLIARIREVDQDSWIFFEPLGFMVVTGLPSYLPALTDTRNGEPRLAYIPHLYEPTVAMGLPYLGQTLFIKLWLIRRNSELKRHKCPLFIGEFGGNETQHGFNRYLRDLLRMTDNRLSGWFLWASDPGMWGVTDGKGNENAKLDELVYSYPQRIAGYPETICFNRDSRSLTVKYRDRPGVEGPTEIYVPVGRMYKGGFEVYLSDPQGAWQWDAERNIVSVFIPPSPGHTMLHEIKVVPVSD